MSIFGNASETSFAAEVATAAAEAEKAPPPTPEPAPEPAAAAPEIKPETPPENNIGQQPEAKPEKEPEKFVPLAALQEERQQRQQRERDYNNLMEAFNRFQQLQTPQQQEQPFDPLDSDASQDPFAVIQALQQRVRQFEDGARAQTETEQLKTAYLGTIRQAVTADAGFQDAYNHLVQSRVKELTAMGMNPLAANETIKQEELHLARTAFMNGRNPAEVIMGYAQARGYAPKAKEPPPPPPAAEQVTKQAERAAAATSLSGGGKPPANDLSITDASNLKGAAFDAWWDKNMSTKSSSMFRR